MSATKYVYCFGGGTADGRTDMKNLLGGKGANLAEMANLGIPVPAGFTITTEVCTYYDGHGRTYPEGSTPQVDAALAATERIMGMRFGDPADPLLVSVRSGARSVDAGHDGDGAQRRPVLGDDPGPDREDRQRALRLRRLPPADHDVLRRGDGEGGGHRARRGQGHPPAARPHARGGQEGQGLRLRHRPDAPTTSRRSSSGSRPRSRRSSARTSPTTRMEQLWGGIGAVFACWNGKRAVSYRRIEGIPDEWGTAVNVQAWSSATWATPRPPAWPSPATRPPARTSSTASGWSTPRARTWWPASARRTRSTRRPRTSRTSTCRRSRPRCPRSTASSHAIRDRLEQHYRTCRTSSSPSRRARSGCCRRRIGKRTGTAALNMAMDMLAEGLIDDETAVMRVEPAQLDELLHPIVDPAAEKKAEAARQGPAGRSGRRRRQDRLHRRRRGRLGRSRARR